MFHVKQRQHELSATGFRAAKNNDVFTPTLPLGQNKRSFVVKRPWRNDQKQAGFPGCRDLDDPDQASTALLRTLRSPTPVPSPLHAHGRLRPTFDLRLDPHPVSCAGRMSGLRGPRARDKISKRRANGMARPGNLAGVVNTPHARCWAQGFLRLAECPGLVERGPDKSDIAQAACPPRSM